MPQLRNPNGTVVSVPERMVEWMLATGWTRVGPDSDQGPTQTQPPAPAPAPAPVADGPPPRGGKGSSDAAWTTYARSHGVEVTDDMTRREVIAACEAAGVRVD